MILFRCDSSFEIGTGHVNRCLNLAKLILKASPDKTIEFICQELPGNISQMIRDQGFVVHKEFSDYKKCSWLVVDTYSIDEKIEQKIAKHVKIFVIDDLFNRKHFCHVLLDQNYHAVDPDYTKLVPTGCRLLLGPKFCLLNPELVKAKTFRKVSSTPQVLCFFGGADDPGYLLRLAESLLLNSSSVQFKLVALSSHKHLSALKNLVLPGNIELMIDPKNWVKLLESSDFYFGSGGTVTWERMFLGLPGAVLSVATNQETSSTALAQNDYQLYWGTASNFDFGKAIERIESVLRQPKNLEQLSANGLKLVDRFSLQLVEEIFLGQS